MRRRRTDPWRSRPDNDPELISRFSLIDLISRSLGTGRPVNDPERSQSASEKNKTASSGVPSLRPSLSSLTLSRPPFISLPSASFSSVCLLLLFPRLFSRRFFHLFWLHTIMRASHVEKGLFAARDRKCRASLIIGCTTTTILERLRFRHRFPPSLLPSPATAPFPVPPRGERTGRSSARRSRILRSIDEQELLKP